MENYNYLELQCENNQQLQVALAMLYAYPFDSIWEGDVSAKVYFKKDIDKMLIDEILSVIKPFVLSSDWKSEEQKNWNEDWEKNFPPVAVDDYCFVYADFHKKESGFKHYVHIAPKMAFGTGHHETTFLMIQQIKELAIKGKSVLDLGCGTGILSIVAAKENAAKVVGIDNQKSAYENAIEHAEMNRVDCQFYHGEVADMQDEKYDIILANINRKVLLDNAERINGILSDKGTLVLSGILRKDIGIIEEAYQFLDLQRIVLKGKWCCFLYKR